MTWTRRAGVGLAIAAVMLVGGAFPATGATDSTMTPARLETLLDTYRGKVVLLDYWATWCPPCRDAAPELDALYREFSGQGLEVVGVSFDRDERPVEKFIARHKLSYPVYIGTSELKQLQNVSVLPTTVLIARDGSAAGRYIGYLPHDTLEAKIRALLAEDE